MSPQEFIEFSALMALFAFITSPLNTLFMYLSRKVARLCALDGVNKTRPLYFEMQKNVAIFFLVAGIPLLLYSGDIESILKINSPLALLSFYSLILFSAFQTTNSAFIQGFQNFKALGILGVIQSAIKIIASLILIILGYGVSGAIFGVSISILIITCVGVQLIIGATKPGHESIQKDWTGKEFKDVMSVLIANISFVAMTQLDVFYVNIFFPPVMSAEYAAASVFGRAVLYLPGGLALALFPMVARNHANNKSSEHLLGQALLTTLILGTFVSIIYYCFGGLIMQIFYGEKYHIAGEILGGYGFSMVPMGLIMVFEHFLIATGRVFFAWVFMIIAPLQFLIIYFWHPNLNSVILVNGLMGLTIICFGIIILRNGKFN
jgi:O-antigen/teichoic acid export membrane protein